MDAVERIAALCRGVMAGVITEREFADAVQARVDLLRAEVGR